MSVLTEATRRAALAAVRDGSKVSKSALLLRRIYPRGLTCDGLAEAFGWTSPYGGFVYKLLALPGVTAGPDTAQTRNGREAVVYRYVPGGVCDDYLGCD